MFRYHNTTDERGTTLDKNEANALSQDGKILALFRKFPLIAMTPPEVWSLAFSGHNRPLLTSVRRAMSNLTKEGYLEKIDKRNGIYGRPNHAWKLK